MHGDTIRTYSWGAAAAAAACLYLKIAFILSLLPYAWVRPHSPSLRLRFPPSFNSDFNMNPRMAAHTVFGIPELALRLFAFVPLRDLAQCIRVCKEWFQHAEPHLWTHYSPGLPNNRSMISPQETNALIRNLSRLRSVELKSHEVSVLQHLTVHLQPGISVKTPSNLCTNLRRLKMECYYNVLGLRLPPIIQLLDHNLQLTHLTLPVVALTIDKTLLTAISNLRCLRHLTLKSIAMNIGSRDFYSGTRTIPSLLQACLPLPELMELFLDFDMVWYDNIGPVAASIADLETIIKEAAITRFLDNGNACRKVKVKSLRLPICREGSRSPLPIPLLRSGVLDLESFRIPTFSVENTNPQEVEHIVRESCPRLTHVICPSEEETTQHDDRFTRAFLRGCSGLQSFTSDHFSDQTQIYNDDDNDEQEVFFPSIESPWQGWQWRPRWIISELISYHHRTLENFELKQCDQVWSKDLQAILSRCHRLKRFWVEYHSRASQPGLDFTDVMSGGDWVCMGLRVLCLTLNRHLTVEETHHLSSERIAQAAKHVYTQIGRLHQLEVLVLNITRSVDTSGREDPFPWDLTLSRGWLGEMSGLKNLKTIRLLSDVWSRMGQAEVEFMRERWSSLGEIRLY
ncbi:hypothetical protein EC968_005035, partial [Mortierella alpina]